jgi:hypothetical protein
VASAYSVPPRHAPDWAIRALHRLHPVRAVKGQMRKSRGVGHGCSQNSGRTAPASVAGVPAWYVSPATELYKRIGIEPG